MLLVLDFDGTITTEDTLVAVARAWAPEALAIADARLRRGEFSLNEEIAFEFVHVHAELDEVLAFLRERVQLRPGLAELVDFCRARFVEVVVVSSGFHELIEPVLRWHDVYLPVLAHHATFSRDGATVAFVERPSCPVCGQPCKRMELARVTAQRQVAYVGDGYSDRCAAEAADLVFARDGLARYLGERGVAFTPFADLYDVRAGLTAFLAPA